MLEKKKVKKKKSGDEGPPPKSSWELLGPSHSLMRQFVIDHKTK